MKTSLSFFSFGHWFTILEFLIGDPGSMHTPKIVDTLTTHHSLLTIHYSLLKLFTGLLNAALTA